MRAKKEEVDLKGSEGPQRGAERRTEDAPQAELGRGPQSVTKRPEPGGARPKWQEGGQGQEEHSRCSLTLPGFCRFLPLSSTPGSQPGASFVTIGEKPQC